MRSRWTGHWYNSFTMNYFRTPADGDSPQISLVDVANMSGLPPATIIAAEIDPLQTDGRNLFGRFVAAGVPVDYRLYVGTTHGIFWCRFDCARS